MSVCLFVLRLYRHIQGNRIGVQCLEHPTKMAPTMAEHYQLDVQNFSSSSACYILRTAERLPGQCWLHRYLDLDEPAQYVFTYVDRFYPLTDMLQCL